MEIFRADAVVPVAVEAVGADAVRARVPATRAAKVKEAGRARVSAVRRRTVRHPVVLPRHKARADKAEGSAASNESVSFSVRLDPDVDGAPT